MNDYWNDPPEQDEPPDCCGEIMEVDAATGAVFCLKCGRRIEPQKDCCEIPDTEPVEAIQETPAKCPHGNEWHECDRCLHESDLAYDAQREKRR